jgi:hypothetical protein
MDFFQISSRNILAAETVRTDVHAPYFGAELAAHSLTPGPDARIAPTRFEDWLSQSVTERRAS